MRFWVLKNHGVQKLLAQHFGVSKAHIHGVLHCKQYSENGRIEAALADLGAPGMRKRELEAKARVRQITWTDQEKQRLMEQLRKIQADKAKKAVA